VDGLARFLGANPPFCALADSELENVAAAARVVDRPAGALIIDAFASAGDDLFVVMAGQVELWTTDAASDPSDEIIGRGCVFGHTTALTGAPLGPRAAALGPVRRG
jgi:CBS domain-containing protein